MEKITKVDLYFNLIRLGRIKLEEVPQEYKKEVSKILNPSETFSSEE